MATTYRLQDPQDVLDHAWDWSAFLAESETITEATVVVEDGDLEVADDPAVSHTDSVVTAWLEGGTAGTEAVVTCHIVTNQGREKDWSVKFRITHR